MKRQSKKQYHYGVSSIWSIFNWCQCEKCKKDFRRERGWSFLGGPFHGGAGIIRYVCAECMPEEQSVHDFASNSGYVPKDARLKTKEN